MILFLTVAAAAIAAKMTATQNMPIYQAESYALFAIPA